MTASFWQGKKVFITGHTGFKGTWLTIWLKHLGAEITGYALAPDHNPNLFTLSNIEPQIKHHIGDICDANKLTEALANSQADIVLHLAAQALVKTSYEQPVQTFDTNVKGSQNLLESLRLLGEQVKAVVMVSTDKCYENKNWHWGYRENEPLGGLDPYSASKACMELMISSYRHSYFKQTNLKLASVRAGNVIGGGDWADNRLVPDILTAIEKKQDLHLRYPNATRPWQHVLEPLSGYLMLAERLYRESIEGKNSHYADAWNFGPSYNSVKPVKDIANYLINQTNSGIKLTVPVCPPVHSESEQLALDCSKAQAQLAWSPKWNLNQALDAVLDWQQSFNGGEDILNTCIRQIKNHEHSQ